MKKLYFLAVIFFVAITTAVLALGARGGWQAIPINEGEVCFSSNQCANDAAINPLWNLIHSFIETRDASYFNAYRAMDDADAEKIFKELYAVQQDTTVSLFKIAKPNICFIILDTCNDTC